MKQITVFFIVMMFFTGVTAAGKGNIKENIKGNIKYVDPFIGTGGHGHTYPGAALPFGMVQLSPDTRLTGWDGCSGYHYSDSIIYGFSHTHLSGTGVSDYGDILLMPFTNDKKYGEKCAGKKAPAACSSFSHAKEKASPGFYSVRLDDFGIKAELTVTPRTGIHRYTFPSGSAKKILVDLTHRDSVVDSGITMVNNREIHGFRRSSAWAKDQHVYFAARFSKSFKSYEITKNGRLTVNREGREGKERGINLKAVLSFDSSAGDMVEVRVGISAVSIAGARKNLEVEALEKNFDEIRRAAEQRWSKALGKIKIKGGTDSQKRVFYTALYHVLLNPNLYMDVDGKYRGRDLGVHVAKKFDYYTVFSLWDTYRTAHPLFTIIEPVRTNDFIKTFLAQYDQGGLLPVWELAANETGCMIGYHAVPVIVDAFVKGYKNYDVKKAYEAIKKSAEQDHLGLKDYKQLGYIRAEEEAESVSKTLEYAYDDWCIAQMAKALGNKKDYVYYISRAQSYKNLFDPSTGFMRAKLKGTWFSPFDPAEVNAHYTEANSWQYSFYVPQDIVGLMALMGGKQAFVEKLDRLFSTDSRTTGRKQADITGLIGQYAHGNEPSHHMAYLYAYMNQPWKTQALVRRIMDTLYTDKPDGLCGNEDCGQMSAWYIMSAAGFYPVTPGQDIYVIGTPLFKEMRIDTGKGRRFTVSAPNVSSKNFYIQSASLNGKPITRSWIRHQEIIRGGKLEFKMGPKPNKTWGSKDKDIPYSAIRDHLVLPVPYVKTGSRVFRGSTVVELGHVEPGAEIYYTLDGTAPNHKSKRYGKPFRLDKTARVKAIAFKKGFPVSTAMSAEFVKITGNRKIKLNSRYAPQYSAGGDMALIDGIRGTYDFRTGTWQGYEGVDLNAVVDLGKTKEIEKISIGFLQDNNAWIFMPLEVRFYLSVDGKSFDHAATVKNDIPHRREGSIIKEFTAAIDKENARYIKIKAKAIGKCPSWHKGAGNKAWIFADEIVIK